MAMFASTICAIVLSCWDCSIPYALLNALKIHSGVFYYTLRVQSQYDGKRNRNAALVFSARVRDGRRRPGRDGPACRDADSAERALTVATLIRCHQPFIHALYI
jgi:hypothetical protein